MLFTSSTFLSKFCGWTSHAWEKQGVWAQKPPREGQVPQISHSSMPIGFKHPPHQPAHSCMIKDKITRTKPLGGQAEALEGTLNGRHREDAVQKNINNRQRSRKLAILTPAVTRVRRNTYSEVVQHRTKCKSLEAWLVLVYGYPSSLLEEIVGIQHNEWLRP